MGATYLLGKVSVCLFNILKAVKSQKNLKRDGQVAIVTFFFQRDHFDAVGETKSDGIEV